MNFVMNRSKVVSGHGHAVEFEKGKPTHVPPELYALVIAAGAVAEGDADFDLDDKPKVPAGAPADPQERKDAVFQAFEVLVETNDSSNFTAGGTPTAKALASLVGWSLQAKEIATLWVEFKAKAKDE